MRYCGLLLVAVNTRDISTVLEGYVLCLQESMVSSLRARKENTEVFAQRLLGHKNLTMAQKYLDARGAEYVMV